MSKQTKTALACLRIVEEMNSTTVAIDLVVGVWLSETSLQFPKLDIVSMCLGGGKNTVCSTQQMPHRHRGRFSIRVEAMGSGATVAPIFHVINDSTVGELFKFARQNLLLNDEKEQHDAVVDVRLVYQERELGHAAIDQSIMQFIEPNQETVVVHAVVVTAKHIESKREC